MTRTAEDFITPLTFETLTNGKVYQYNTIEKLNNTYLNNIQKGLKCINKIYPFTDPQKEKNTQIIANHKNDQKKKILRL